MPYKSEVQRRLFFAAATTPPKKWRGKKKPKITLVIAKRWWRETPNPRSLPERVNKRKKAAKLVERLLRR